MAFEIDRVRDIADRVAASRGLEIVELELRGGGKKRMLRLTIDKPEGVTHDDCANVSRELGTILDVEDVMPGGSYLLEVSSPGLDRKLVSEKDYQRFIGSLVKITTRESVNGNHHLEGRLEAFQDGRLTLELLAARNKSKKKTKAAPGPAEKLQVDLANIERANLVPEI
jgi:ribosome maturation factor RimP